MQRNKGESAASLSAHDNTSATLQLTESADFNGRKPPRSLVGYNTCSELQASDSVEMYSMLAIPFEGVDGKGISLNSLNFSNPTKNNSSTKADRIMLWVKDEKGIYDYETFYLTKSSGWRNAETMEYVDDEYQNGLPAGTTFWYVSPAKATAAGTMTTSGAVMGDSYDVKTISRGQYNFVSFPYPVGLKLNDSTMVNWGNAVKNNGSTKADMIMLWLYNEESKEFDYVTYYLTKSNGWRNATTLEYFQNEHPNGVTVGTGFWYNAQPSTDSDTFDITFYSPLEKAAE